MTTADGRACRATQLKEETMTTADVVRERALALARSRVDAHEAVHELEICCGGGREVAVRARRQLVALLDSEPDQRDAMLAMGFLDQLIDPAARLDPGR
jgi:hypothetical protein